MNSIKSFFKMFVFLFKYSKKITIGIVLFTLILGLFPVIETYYLSYLTSNIFNNFDIIYIIILISFYIILIVVKKIINYLYEKFRIRSRVIFSNKLNSLIISKSINIDILYKQTAEYKDIESRAKDAVNIEKVMMLINTLCNILIAIISLLSFTIYLISINYLTVIIIVALFLLTYPIRKKANLGFFNIYRLLTNDNRKLTEYENSLTNSRSIVELKINDGLDYMQNKWIEQYDRNKKIELREKTKTKLYTSIVSLVNDVLSLLLQYVVLVLQNSFTVFNITYVTSAQNRVIGNLTSIGMNLSYSQNVYESFNDFFKFIEIQEIDYFRVSEKELPAGISINNVSFKYLSDSDDVIKDLTLNINPGEKIMIVGENGSGKSTLAKLILGFYKPTKGKIEYYSDDGTINNFPQTSVLLQNPAKYMSTIKENVILSDLQKNDSDSELNNVLLKYEIKRETNDLNLDSKIGMEFGGTELSGGQWQRLSFARCMYKKNKSLIVFDEPNQALDSKIEEKYSDFMFSIKNSTIIIIAHRLIYSKFVDKIIYMENGKIVEMGCYEDLMNKKGKFYELYSLQANQFE